MDLFCPGGFAAGSGSSGIIGQRRNGATLFRCFSDGRYSRCPRRAFLAFCPLHSNVSPCTSRRPGSRMGEESQMTKSRRGHFSLITLCALIIAAFAAPSARATGITLPPEVLRAMDELYGGDPDAAIAVAHDVENAQPDHPLGYLLEAKRYGGKGFAPLARLNTGSSIPGSAARNRTTRDFLRSPTK